MSEIRVVDGVGAGGTDIYGIVPQSVQFLDQAPLEIYPGVI